VKLLNKTFLYYFVSTAFIFIAGGLVFYLLTNEIFYNQIDQGLTTEKEIIAEEIENNDNVPDFSARFGHQIEVVLYNRPITPIFLLEDTVLESNNNSATYRYLNFNRNLPHGKSYSIKIFHPIDERSEFLNSLLIIILIMFIALFLFLIFINYFIAKQIWIPFYHTIYSLSRYNVNDKSTFSLPETNIHEFKILNRVVNNMSEKIKKDFLNMKEFTENASHEIQTPLAVIKSKVELLFQKGQLDTYQIEALQVINDSVSRLSKLNSGLILLTKIDNRQFIENKEIDVLFVLDKILDNLEDLLLMKQIKVEKDYSQKHLMKLNPVLCEILISNLLSNAIKHNIPEGFISVSTDASSIIISNSGHPLSIPEGELFKRFKKENSNSQSLGLGLALVKKICEVYKIDLSYTCNNSIHTFVLSQSLNSRME
jgi:signal transduction histidine kinase